MNQTQYVIEIIQKSHSLEEFRLKANKEIICSDFDCLQ